MSKICITIAMILACLPLSALSAAPTGANKKALARGEWLVGYGGCHDCHTPGWAEYGGRATREVLLTGGGTNFQGPWGTTYAPNLRLRFQQMTLAQWLTLAHSMKARPAMPYWTFRYLSDKDLADMYAYIHSLGPAGQPAHAYVPPGQDAPAPYLKLVLPAAASAKP